MRPEDYGTISKMNIPGAAITSYTIVVYDENNSVIANKTITNPIGISSAEESKLVHFPIGPANFKDDATLNILSTTDWSLELVVSVWPLHTFTNYRDGN